MYSLVSCPYHWLPALYHGGYHVSSTLLLTHSLTLSLTHSLTHSLECVKCMYLVTGTVMGLAGDQWWLMNDDTRHRVHSSQVHSSDAYMLFYVRVNPRQHPPVVPPSHVTPPSSKKRCAPWSPLEDGEVGAANNMDSIPLCKRAKYQQRPAASALTDAHNDQKDAMLHKHAPDAVRSHTRTDLLSQPNSLHAIGNGNSPVGLHDEMLISSQAKQQNNEEDMGLGEVGNPSTASGPSFIGPPTRPPQSSANGGLLTYQHRQGTGQRDSAPQLCLANGAGWTAAGAQSDQPAATTPTMLVGNNPSTAADGSSKRFGFMGFSLSKPLTGQSGSKHSPAVASTSQPACMTPPSQKLNSAHNGLEQQVLLLGQRKHLLAIPMKSLSFDEQSGTKPGQKRSRAEVFAEGQRQSDYDVELIEDDEVAPAQNGRTSLPSSQTVGRCHTPAWPPPSPKQSMHKAAGSLPTRVGTKSQAESCSLTDLPLVSIYTAVPSTLCFLFLLIPSPSFPWALNFRYPNLCKQLLLFQLV